VLYTVHVTAFSLRGRFFWTRCIYRLSHYFDCLIGICEQRDLCKLQQDSKKPLARVYHTEAKRNKA